MKITFTGKGILVAFLSIIPMLCEATTNALIGRAVFNMPFEISFSLGFAVASVATAIVVP
jgi:hypothetical protein